MDTPSNNESLRPDDVAAVDRLHELCERLEVELGKAIVGQRRVIHQLLTCLFARGHALLLGVPGLAKTLLVRQLAEVLDLEFRRIQFTPDLMPMDITGTDILQEEQGGRRRFEFIEGPLFANLVLADEINRAPSKTQAAMLEAMQEQRTTILGRTYDLPQPFFVMATQNPIEQEGTYPLPEAQLDRFMLQITVDYPNRDDELQIARTTTGSEDVELKALVTASEVADFQALVRRMPVPANVYETATDLVRQTRPQTDDAPEWLRPLVSWGAGPRAVQNMVLGAKAHAALRGEYMVQVEDVIAVAEAVLVHRLVTTFAAESKGVGAREIVKRLINDLTSN